jgi:hypothetical protein
MQGMLFFILVFGKFGCQFWPVAPTVRSAMRRLTGNGAGRQGLAG